MYTSSYKQVWKDMHYLRLVISSLFRSFGHCKQASVLIAVAITAVIVLSITMFACRL